MSLNTRVSKEMVQDYYNGLVKQYKKNVQFFVTPTNETYQIWNGYNNYNQEYLYKFCHNSGVGTLRINNRSYTSTSSLSCSYIRQDGTSDYKNGGTSGTLGINEYTYSNGITTVPTLTIENYGGVFTNEVFIIAFVTISFIAVYKLVSNIMPKLK